MPVIRPKYFPFISALPRATFKGQIQPAGRHLRRPVLVFSGLKQNPRSLSKLLQKHADQFDLRYQNHLSLFKDSFSKVQNLNQPASRRSITARINCLNIVQVNNYTAFLQHFCSDVTCIKSMLVQCLRHGVSLAWLQACMIS